MTGNEEDGESEPQTRGRSKWRPAGRITAYDNIVGGAIPLNYVRVRARRCSRRTSAIQMPMDIIPATVALNVLQITVSHGKHLAGI